MSSHPAMTVSLVERCWSVAGAVSTVLAALGRAEPRLDVLTRAVTRHMNERGDPGSPGAHGYVDRRADLYTIDPHALRCIAEDVEREMEDLMAELAARGRPDLDEDVIAEAARMELAARDGRASSVCHELEMMISRFSLLCGYVGRDDEEEAEVHALAKALDDAGVHPGWPICEREARFIGRRKRRHSDTQEILRMLGWTGAWPMSATPAPVIARALLSRKLEEAELRYVDRLNEAFTAMKRGEL